MVGLVPTPARYASIEARLQVSPIAAVLIDVATERQELLVRIDPDTGHLTANLHRIDFESLGAGPVALAKLSSRTTMASTTVTLSGYDTTTDRCRQLTASISIAWTVSGSDPSSVEVAGTALVTDPDLGNLVRFRAVRSHPFNRLQLSMDRVSPPGPDKGVAQHPFDDQAVPVAS